MILLKFSDFLWLGCSLLIIVFCNKFSFLTDKKNKLHKTNITNTENRNFLLGGVFLIFFFILNYNLFELSLLISFILIFLLGLSSDTQILENPKYRFILQIIIVLIYISFSDLKITDVRIEYFNNLLENRFINICFVLFCLMIVINGFNFIDGINNLALFYFLLILISITFFLNSSFLIFDKDLFLKLIFIVIVILFLNYFGIVFLGDSGAYLIGFFIGCSLIEIYNNNPFLSPYYIILLVWYPCFEVLFSILRRIIIKKNYSNPDNNHLHHLIFQSIKFKTKFKNLNFLHFKVSSMIIIPSIILFFISSFYPSKTIIMIISVFVLTIIYCVVYFILRRIDV